MFNVSSGGGLLCFGNVKQGLFLMLLMVFSKHGRHMASCFSSVLQSFLEPLFRGHYETQKLVEGSDKGT
jgi:hypothetical protein